MTVERDLAAELLRIGPSRPVRRRSGTIMVVNADGTVTVDLGDSGVESPPMAYMASYTPAVGDTVFVDIVGTDPVVIGKTSTSGEAFGLWTPTLTQTNVITAAAGTEARFTKTGRRVFATLFFDPNSAGVAGVAITLGLVGLPPPRAANRNIGTFDFTDAGVTQYQGAVRATSLTEARFIVSSNGSFLGASPNFAVAAADFLWATLEYEAAS